MEVLCDLLFLLFMISNSLSGESGELFVSQGWLLGSSLEVESPRSPGSSLTLKR